MNKVARKKVAANLVLILAVLNPQISFAIEEWPEVNVRGKKDKSQEQEFGGFRGGGSMPAGNSGGGRGAGGVDGRVALSRADVTQDVRCWTTTSSAMVSTEQAEARHGIAMAIYKVHLAAKMGVKVGEYFKITWADGGSTEYLVLANGVEGLLEYGTEKDTPGDGVVKPGPVCGKT